MAYQIRAYSKEDNTVHDIKKYNFENGLNMSSTYKDTQLNLDNTEYIIIQSSLLKDLLGIISDKKVVKKTNSRKSVKAKEVIDDHSQTENIEISE